MGSLDLSEELLFKEIKIGNRKAFSALFNSQWDKLYQAAYKILLSDDLAQDAVQEVFFDLWSRRSKLEINNISGFLYKAVRYQSLKQLRKNKPLQIHEDRFQEILDNCTVEQLDFQELMQKLDKKLETLSDKQRQIFEMSRFQNLSNNEIAKELSLSQRTVEWYLYKVLKELKATLSILLFILILYFTL